VAGYSQGVAPVSDPAGPGVNDLRFDSQVIAITGAHHGLGRAHALFLAGRGARIVANDIQGAEETVQAVQAAGGDAIENRSDITTGRGTDDIVEAALDTWGRLDVVVNNAAAGGGTIPDEAMVAATLGVHFVGTVNLIRSALPVFRKQRYGRIVNTGSGSILGIPQTGIYAAGKAAVLAFSRVLSNELAAECQADPGLDIKINVYMPAAMTPNMPRVPDEAFQTMLDQAFAPARTSPLVAVLAHQVCPVSGEAIQIGGGRVSRFILATSAGWAASGQDLQPEDILDHWDDVMAGKELAEPVGSMSDLLGRSGFHPYSVAELVQWAKTGVDPSSP
jgi:NAD(P)-dependent dehydrogenase (short-subunit alcohol dehydrogenase family)